MDFLDPVKKRAQNRRLTIGYILVAIALALGSLVILFRTYGYDLDRKTGRVIQNGLIYLSAAPDQATVYLNGKNEGKTDARLTKPSGRYKIKLNSEGYKPWQKTITLDGGSVERLSYPRLFPTKLVSSPLARLAKRPSLITTSPNKRWLIVGQPGSLRKFDEYNLSASLEKSTSITLPKNLLTASSAGHKIGLVEWANDNRHFLIKHSFKGGHEFIVIDRQTPKSSVNINRVLSNKSATITLRNGRYNSYYVFDRKNQQLLSGDLKSKNTRLILNNVTSFKSFGDNTILYATSSGAPKNKILIKVLDGDSSYTIRSLAARTDYLLGLAKFDGRWLMLVGDKSKDQVYIYEDPFSVLRLRDPGMLPTAITLKLNKPAHVSFSPNHRFVSVQRGAEFAVYDALDNRRYYYSLGQGFSNNSPAFWMDEYRLYTIHKGRMLVFDFDGINRQFLTPAIADAKVFFNPDYKSLYSLAPFGKRPGQVALTQTELTVKK